MTGWRGRLGGLDAANESVVARRAAASVVGDPANLADLGGGRMRAQLASVALAEAAVRFESLTVRYGSHVALHQLDAEIPAGVLMAIIGPNGAGKSTLVNAITGVKRADEGRLILSPRVGARIAYLPQQSALDRTFPIRVLDLVLMGAWERTGALREARHHEWERAEGAIAAAGLGGLEKRLIGTLSVGQLQRALFARALMQDAQLLLLDEPFAALDRRTTLDLMRLLRSWREQGRTVVAVLHDLELVHAHFNYTMGLARRCIACGETAAVATADNLRLAGLLGQQWPDSPL
jgi:zinc/manganese transport system ATP-binding protein